MLKRLLCHFIEDCIRGISGPIGTRLRRAYYRRRFKNCGAGLVIEPGVHILNPQCISVGADVWIDTHCVLLAGPIKTNELTRHKSAQTSNIVRGEIEIGTGSHLAIGTVIQGHGGVTIDDHFGASAGVKIYSLSNDPYRGKGGPVTRPGNVVPRIETPVLIERNVWLGINVNVVGAHIGADTFVKPSITITGTVAANSVVSCNSDTDHRPRYPEDVADVAVAS